MILAVLVSVGEGKEGKLPRSAVRLCGNNCARKADRDKPAVTSQRQLTSHEEEGRVMRSRTPFPVSPRYAYTLRQQNPRPTAIHNRPETGPYTQVWCLVRGSIPVCCGSHVGTGERFKL